MGSRSLRERAPTIDVEAWTEYTKCVERGLRGQWFIGHPYGYVTPALLWSCMLTISVVGAHGVELAGGNGNRYYELVSPLAFFVGVVGSLIISTVTAVDVEDTRVSCRAVATATTSVTVLSVYNITSETHVRAAISTAETILTGLPVPGATLLLPVPVVFFATIVIGALWIGYIAIVLLSRLLLLRARERTVT